MDGHCSYMVDFFEPLLGKYSILEATKQIFVQRNDSFIDLCQKKKNYHHRRLVWLISLIESQRNMICFAMDGHIPYLF